MKVVPSAGPQPVSTLQAKTPTQSSARDRAMAILTQAPTAAEPTQVQAQSTPVANPNNISPEEMGAIKAPQVTEETTQVEEETTQVEAAPAPTEAEIQANKRFTMLAKQEKALRAKELALKQREAALEAQANKFKEQPAFDESKYIAKDRFKQDPLSIMAETGLSYEELTNMILNQPNRDPRVDAEFNSMKQQIEELKRQNEEARKAAEDQQTQAYQTAVKQIESDVKALIKQDPSYEAIRTAGAYKDVVELIEQTYQKDGVLLSNEEACQLVEEYLVEEYTKLTNIDKIKKRLVAASAKPEQATSAKTNSESNQPQQTSMKTLTNSIGSTRKLSSRERAILAFNGENKK